MLLKKFLSIVVVLFVVIGLFSACSPQEPEQTEKPKTKEHVKEDAKIISDVAPEKATNSYPTLADKRDFSPRIDGKWIGNGISYGAYRDGEEVDVDFTSAEDILEDMNILLPRWQLIRLYGADQQAENILKVIRVE